MYRSASMPDASFRTPCATYWQPTPSCWCCRRNSGADETTESAATLVLCDAAARFTFLFRSSRRRSQVSSDSCQDFALGTAPRPTASRMHLLRCGISGAYLGMPRLAGEQEL